MVFLVSADEPYYPCKSYIGFYYDDSNVLSYANFKTQMNFIKTAIANLNNPQRIAAEGGYGGEFTWNSKLSITQMQSALNLAEQISISYSLLAQFSSLATNFENLNDYYNLFGVLIFISDTSDTALKNADRLLSKLKGIRLTFVLLGPNVDSSKLTNFSSNFIYWPDLTQPQPDSWDLLSYHAYGCDTPIGTTTPAPGSYYPCQNWITVLADNSNKLTAAQFQVNYSSIFNTK
uniref:Uncharacterized protein n=1 Tax=Panagrolaimus superbus TaxID=310955 RepID=A0A914Z3W2_9BILA